MGYPQFSLTTLQLPAPTSNFTRAEYKEAYGIDLDAVDIRSFKLVVYGNEKYAIDQIKEVEGGVEIYFNGRILTITDIVQTSDKIYDVSFSKPIYWHNVRFKRAGDGVSYFEGYLIILNSSPSPIDVSAFANILRTPGFYGIVLNGLIEQTAGATEPSSASTKICSISYKSETQFTLVYKDSDNKDVVTGNITIDPTQWTIEDLGTNILN